MRIPPPLPYASALLLIGCARPDYDEVRAGCGLAPGEHRVFERDRAGTWNLDIDAPCATLLGEAIGFDWQSVGLDGPQSLEGPHPDEQAASVLGGLLLLASADFGPATPAVLAEAPQPLQDALRRVAPLRGPDASLGELMFTSIQAAIDKVIRIREWPWTEGALATWSVDHRMRLTPSWSNDGSAALGMGILVHESLHREGPHSLDCGALDADLPVMTASDGVTRPDCDWNEDSVYGGAAWVLNHLLRAELDRLPPGLPLTDAEDSDHLILTGGWLHDICTHICKLEPDGPCAWIVPERSTDEEACTLGRGYSGGH